MIIFHAVEGKRAAIAATTVGSGPRVLLHTDLRSAVLERWRNANHFHPRLLELAAHYHFAPSVLADCLVRADIMEISLPDPLPANG